MPERPSRWSTPGGTDGSTAGDHPQGALRFDGTLHRRAHRALRRGVPVWLAPVQAVVLPITDGQLDYARKFARMSQPVVACKSGRPDEKVGYKIRMGDGASSVYAGVGRRNARRARLPGPRSPSGDTGAVPVDEFVPGRRSRSFQSTHTVGDRSISQEKRARINEEIRVPRSGSSTSTVAQLGS